MKQILKNWEKATQELTNGFLKQYFDEPDWYWIADEIGGTLFVNDWFFNLERIVECARYKPTYKQLIDFYELELDFAMKGKPMDINFYHYLKQIK